MQMRTTVTIERKLLDELLKTTHASTQSQALRIAAEQFLRHQKIAALDRFRGKVRLNPRILQWRHAQR